MNESNLMDAVTTPKRNLTAAQIASNQRNAQKSTGPRSLEGKAASSMNALKHGLTARQVVLPEEDLEAFQARQQRWFDTYRPSGPAAEVVLGRAVHATWRLDRCARAETARLANRTRSAADEADREALDQAEEFGQRLIFEPVDRIYWDVRDPINLENIARRDRDHPAILVRALTSSAQGVDWLLAQWEELLNLLREFGFWNVLDKYKAIRLLGLRPEDAQGHPKVSAMFVACHAADPDRWDLYATFDQALKGTPARPDSRRVKLLEASQPTPEAGLAVILDLAEGEVARLRALKSDVLDDRAALNRADAADRALFDDSESAVLLRRYETACERELRRSIADVNKFARSVPETMPIDDGGDSSQNEPGATEVETDESVARPPIAPLGEVVAEPAPPAAPEHPDQAPREPVVASALWNSPPT